MTAEWIGALTSLATLVVIATGTLVALRQMRHMRSANQLTALNEMYNVTESDAFKAAVTFVTRDFVALVEDPAVRRQLIAPRLGAEYRPLHIVANFYENFGMLVKRGYLDRNLVADMHGGRILLAWRSLASFVAVRRVVLKNDTLWENFEYLASTCQRFRDRHPKGAYPKRARRMPPAELWPEVSELNVSSETFKRA